MRVNILQALPLALIACAAAYLAIFGRPVAVPPPVAVPSVVGSIDFDALHRQANSALEALRNSRNQRRRLASAAEAS